MLPSDFCLIVAGDGIEPSTSRFSVARSYQLSYPAKKQLATQTGLEPATSAVTGRRANQLRYWANLFTDEEKFSLHPASPTGFEPVLPP